MASRDASAEVMQFDGMMSSLRCRRDQLKPGQQAPCVADPWRRLSIRHQHEAPRLPPPAAAAAAAAADAGTPKTQDQNIEGPYTTRRGQRRRKRAQQLKKRKVVFLDFEKKRRKTYVQFQLDRKTRDHTPGPS